MNTTNPMDFVNALKPEQVMQNATTAARTFIAEMEKQAEKWTEYSLSQSTEAARLVRSMQTQAFGVGKSLVETAEKAFGKVGA